MKKFLLLLVAMLLTSAASFADRVLPRPVSQAPEAEGTEQYLYNVEYGGFLVGANEYGRRVSVSREGGQKFSIDVTEDGTFKIGAISPDGTDGIWLDGARPGNDKFGFTDLGDNKFQITNTKFPDTFLTWSGDESDTRVYFTESSDYGTWYSVSDEAYEEYMSNEGPQQTMCYFAALTLNNLLDQSDELGLDNSSERAVYNNDEATIDQINAAIASLTALINEAKIKQYTLTYDNVTKLLKLTKKGCSSYEATYAGGASLEGYEGEFAFAPIDPEWTLTGNTCIGAYIDLSAGDYTLKVQAGTYLFDGAENEAFEITFTVEGSTELNVTISPSFFSGEEEIALSAESAVSVESADAIKATFGVDANAVKYATYAISEYVVEDIMGVTTTQEVDIATGQLNLNGFGYAEFAQTLFFKAGTKYNLKIKAWDSEDIFNPDYSIKDPIATFTCDFNGAHQEPLITGASLIIDGDEFALNEEIEFSAEKAVGVAAQIHSSVCEANYAVYSAEVNAETGEWETANELVSGAMSVNGTAFAEFDDPVTFTAGSKYIITITAKNQNEDTESASFRINGTYEEEQQSDLDFTNKVVKNVKANTSNIEEGKWYTWSNVRKDGGNYDVPTPFYDQGEGKKPTREPFGQTVRTVLSENAPIADLAKYLVRFTKSDTGEAYHIQFATGNYLKSDLTTSATASEAGLFMVYGATNTKSAAAGQPYTSAGVAINITNDGTTYGDCLDGNGAGNPLVVWGSGKITTGANNVWFMEEVEMGEATTETYTVHIMGAPAPTKVTYGEQQYGNNDTFEATGFSVSALTVPDHENYVKDVYVNGTDIYVSYTYAKKVAALTELSNDKAYMVMCERGQLTTNEGQLAPTAKKSYTDGKSTFAFVKYEDNYYMWSTAENGFVFNDKTIATEGEFQTVGITPQADGTFMLYLADVDHHLNIDGAANLFINNWKIADAGNKYNLYEVESFDPTAALALLTPAPEGFEGVVTSTLDDTVIKSWEEFNGIELTFEGATTIEAFDSEAGIYADLYSPNYEGWYICDEYYNDEGLNCEVKIEGNKITLSGFFDPDEVFSTRAQQRHMAKRGAEKDNTKPQYELTISGLKIDGVGQDVISLYFDAEGNATVKFAPTAVSPEEGTVEGELETVTLTFDKAVSAAEGKVAVVSAMDVEKEKIAEVAPTVSEDGMTATFALNLTESNIYFLTLPEGLFTTEDGEVSEAKEYTWTLKAAPKVITEGSLALFNEGAQKYLAYNQYGMGAADEEANRCVLIPFGSDDLYTVEVTKKNASLGGSQGKYLHIGTGGNWSGNNDKPSATSNTMHFYEVVDPTATTWTYQLATEGLTVGKSYVIVAAKSGKDYAVTGKFVEGRDESDPRIAGVEFTTSTTLTADALWTVQKWEEKEEPQPEVESVENVYIHDLDLNYLTIGTDVNVSTEPFAWNINTMPKESGIDAYGYSLGNTANNLWLNSGTSGYLSKTAEDYNARWFYFFEATITEDGVEATLVDQPIKGGKYVIAVDCIKPANPGLYAIYGSLASGKSDRLDVVKINDTREVPETISLTTENESSNGAISLKKVVWEIQDPATTGIATAATTATTDAIYSITGQRIMKLQKGINIVGGKKVIK